MPSTVSTLSESGGYVCPLCGVERADYEGPGQHLAECPNCGASDDPAEVEGPTNDGFRETRHEVGLGGEIVSYDTGKERVMDEDCGRVAEALQLNGMTTERKAAEEA